MAIEKMQRTTLTAKEAAEYLGISYWLITQLVKRKQIPCSRVGKRILFRKEALDIYLSKKENDSIEESVRKKGGHGTSWMDKSKYKYIFK